MDDYSWETQRDVRPAAPFRKKPETRPEFKLPVSANPPVATPVGTNRPTEPYATACPYLMSLPSAHPMSL